MAVSVLGGEESAFEGDGEGVEGGLPSVHPAGGSFAGRVKPADRQVEALQRGLLVGEVAPRSGRPAHAGVQALYGVGRVDHSTDLGAVVQERHEPDPGGFPQAPDGRILVAPGVVELGEAGSGVGLVDRRVHGPQIACHAVPVRPAREPERVADQVQHLSPDHAAVPCALNAVISRTV